MINPRDQISDYLEILIFSCSFSNLYIFHCSSGAYLLVIGVLVTNYEFVSFSSFLVFPKSASTISFGSVSINIFFGFKSK